MGKPQIESWDPSFGAPVTRIRSILRPRRTWWSPWKRAYLNLIMAALGDIARARRMGAVAQETGLGRESLYKSLPINGNPEFATVLKVVDAPGLRLQVTAGPSDS